MPRVLIFVTFCFVSCLYGKKASEINVNNGANDPNTYGNVSELITSKGYSLEEHIVQTPDGYLLSVLRIPHERNMTLDGHEAKVVLLIHGIFSDASDWIMHYTGQSLGFVLPDNGYDVWFLNTRGSRYSKNHIKYAAKQYNFWDFSFDQVAQYDVPTTIDYILNFTQKDALYIIGHSQGTAAVFAMLSEMPEYNDKVNLFIAFAPVAFIGSTTSRVVKALLPFKNGIMFLIKLMYHGELISNSTALKNLVLSEFDLDTTVLDEAKLIVYDAHYPPSTSGKSLLHFAQLVKSKKFRKFDYGRRENLKHYHQEEPPDYDICRITAPVALFWSTNDQYVNPADVGILRKNLNSLIFDYCIPYPYNHCDYFTAPSVPQLINKPVLKLLAKY